MPQTVQISTLTRERGMSLIEILVAMLIFTAIAIGVVSSTLASARTNRSSEQRGIAVNLAHQVLECAKSQAQAGRPVTGLGCNPTTVPGFTVSPPSIVEDPTGFTGMRQIQVMISWNSPLPGSVILDTLVDG